jgi:hypothetical protein
MSTKKTLELRPEVAAFAQLMEQKLQENEYKAGWRHLDGQDLIWKLRDRFYELEDCVWVTPPENLTPAEVKHLISRDAADVANYAMMVADVKGDLSDEK